jgi:DNA-binding FadR family transcriptional regulator
MTAVVLHSAVVDVIAREIIDGTLTAGATLTLDAIQQRFGVSRTVSREVMRSLEAVTLVRARRRVGLVVQPLREWDLLDPRVIAWRLESPWREKQLDSLTQLRTAVEPVAAGAAARNATPDQREEIVAVAELLAELGRSGDLEAFLEADIRYHSLLLEASGNELFDALHDVLAVTLAGRTHSGLMPRFPRPEAIDAHLAVARAVQAGDGDTAYRTMVGMLGELRADLFGSSSVTRGP